MRSFWPLAIMAAVYIAFSRSSGPGGGVTSDRVRRIAEAIAVAEGFAFPGAPATSPGNIPNSRNNPGNLTDASKPIGSPNWIRTFPTKEAGWAALYAQVEKMLKGSTLYPAHWTIEQVAQRYTGEAAYRNWSNIVSRRLGVSPHSVFSELA